MKLYHHLSQARFLQRLNRFVARCELNGEEILCHVKNTGRLRELLTPGAPVWLEDSGKPARKTRWDLVAAVKDGRVVNIDSQAPNRIFAEWAESGGFLPELTGLRAEVAFGASRFDFSYLRGGVRGYAEIKGVTLFDDRGMAYFPDAPTERGVKHVEELISARRAGHEAALCFVVMREDAVGLRPNVKTHPAFADALREARQAGVILTAVCCAVSADSCTAVRTIPVILDEREE